MKKDMPLEGLRWSRDSGSALYDTHPPKKKRPFSDGLGGTVLWLFIRYFLPNKHKNEFDGTPCAQWLGNQCPKGGHTMPKAWADTYQIIARRGI